MGYRQLDWQKTGGGNKVMNGGGHNLLVVKHGVGEQRAKKKVGCLEVDGELHHCKGLLATPLQLHFCWLV